MFKDFSNLNGVARKAIPPVLSNQLSRGLSLQSGILQRIRDLANEYTSAYNSVSVIKYDENGEPIDVTPSEKMSVPENRLAIVKAWINDARERISVIRDVISSPSTSTRRVLFDKASGVRYNIAGHMLTSDDFGTNLPRSLFGAIVGQFRFKFGPNSSDSVANQMHFIGVTFPDVYRAHVNSASTGLTGAYWKNEDSFSGMIARTDDTNIEIHVFIAFHHMTYRISKSDFQGTVYSSLVIPRISDETYTQESFSEIFSGLTAAIDNLPVDKSNTIIMMASYEETAVYSPLTLTTAAAGFTAEALEVEIDTLNVDEILIPDADLASLEEAI
jgi:hypothetical protein